MLRAKYRHILRFREIGRVLTKHGLGQLLDYLNSGENSVLRRKNSSRVVISLAERLRTALEELGPTFVKLGQLLSTRPDLLPPDMIMELTNLQDKVSPFPFPVVQSILQDELGANYNDFFVHLDPEPLASASIGQVHRGRLWSGEEVVVKVQRPGVKRMVETDLEILFDSARLFSTRTRWGSFYRVSDMAEEFGNSIREELDYTIEGRNAEKFCELFQGETTTRFPRVFWDYSSPRILTLEYVNCIKISNFAELTKAGYNLSLVARNLANAIFRQIYIHGFFSC
ncbi:MAG TPA: AarF/UbiB family protein [Bacillota bacterium]|nr:AarF/UbiB family protein [Bacillota bacterium]